MNRLKFSKDEGSEFYKELNKRIEQYFCEKGIPKTGNKIMVFKIILYFTLDIFFYVLMITSETTLGFYTFYLLMGLSVLLTAFNISHDAAHGVAVKSKFWNKVLFSIFTNIIEEDIDDPRYHLAANPEKFPKPLGEYKF
jgi:linoleoyl-CoA desaturase